MAEQRAVRCRTGEKKKKKKKGRRKKDKEQRQTELKKFAAAWGHNRRLLSLAIFLKVSSPVLSCCIIGSRIKQTSMVLFR